MTESSARTLQTNTHRISIGRQLGLGEKRNSEWWYTADELRLIEEHWNGVLEDRKQDKIAKQEKRKNAQPSPTFAASAPRVVPARRDEAKERYRRSVPRDADGYRVYACDYIGDKDVFKAVSFARTMIRQGVPPGLANHKAAKYYGVARSEVAKYCGQSAGTYATKARRNTAIRDPFRRRKYRGKVY